MKVYNKISSYELPGSIRRIVDPSGPKYLKAMIIRGIKPMPAIDRVIALYALIDDPDREIKQAAVKALFSLPDTILKPALSNPFMHPYVLDFLMRRMPPHYSLRLVIIENPSVSDATLLEAASTSIPEHLEVIVKDHQRVSQNREILKALYENPDTPRPALKSLIKYAQSCGVIISSIPELSGKVEKSIEFKETLEADENDLENIKEMLPGFTDDMIEELSQEDIRQIVSGELPDGFKETFISGDGHNDKVDYHVFYKEFNTMNEGQKIVLAHRGNQEARELLLREPNTMVLLGLVNNPGLTSQEAFVLAQNKSIDERIIRIISHKKNLVRDYRMKLALVYNPKCPISEARMLTQDLGKYDLNALSKSREVSRAIASFAKKLYETKYER